MAATQSSLLNGPGDPAYDRDTAAEDDVEDGDLFGDENEEEPADEDANEATRRLDDSELDSGDDEGREDRINPTIEDDEELPEGLTKQVINAEFARIAPPVGEEFYLFNAPSFLGLAHQGYHPVDYNPPTEAHEPPSSSTSTSTASKFSSYDTAMSTSYWRRDPQNKDLLQSNTRIIRWSDGSLTLQLASDPTKQYNLTTTPLHQNYNSKLNRLQKTSEPYDPTKDSNNYLVAAHATFGLDFQIHRPFDAALKVQPTADQDKLAVERLQQSLRKTQSTFDPFANVKIVREDPEAAKLKAENAEKDAARLERKRLNAQERANTKRERVLGRGGAAAYGRSGGLSIADLEDDGDGTRPSRPSKPNSARRKPRRNRRGSIYSDDEDEDLPRGRTREDEYDREDDFLAASDEELETYEDEDEELPDDEDEDEDAEGEVDDESAANTSAAPAARDRERDRDRDRDRERAQPGPAREGTPKRPADDDGEDGTGAGDGTQGSPQARKKRRVIDDEDDE